MPISTSIADLRRDLLVADTMIAHFAADEADLKAYVTDLRAYIAELEADVVACRELLQEALAIAHEHDRQLHLLRDENKHLRAQLRAVFSGRTIAEERQAIDEEPDQAITAEDAADGIAEAAETESLQTILAAWPGISQASKYEGEA